MRNWTAIITLIADALTLAAILFLTLGLPLFLGSLIH